MSRVRHSTSGRWQYGLLLAVVTMLSWATLPIALKAALLHLDLWTLTWFRFIAAALVMGAWLARRGLLQSFRGRSRGTWLLLLIAATALTGNYMFYLLGLHLTTPAVAQVLVQLAPVLMGLGGILIFGERYSVSQWLGFAALIGGMGIFFHRQLTLFSAGPERLWQGALVIVMASVTWAIYALVQKQLLREFSSPRILLFIYVFALIVLFPVSTPSDLFALDARSWAVVGYCALNTLVAYGAFAEALNHWEASRVGAVLAVTPLGTFAFSALLDAIFPGTLPPDRMDGLAFAGAVLAVAGSMLASLAGRRGVKDLS